MNHLSLFSGIGGIDLAAEWSGFKTIAFCEQDKYCQQVLIKHWPGVPIYDDVRKLSGADFNEQRIDLISGGFPCQDISSAGHRFGITGQRSGLWKEFFRVICEIRPKYVFVENVSALLQSIRGEPAPIATVLADLASIGYDCEWDSVCAADAGAPHKRQRVFIISYPNKINGAKRLGNITDRARSLLKKAYKERSEVWLQTSDQFLRVGDGVSERLYKDRVGALGNAVVPQQAYPYLKAIAELEQDNAASTTS